jgi:hypothetical protein
MEKLKSRSFWFAVVWTLFVPLAFIAQIYTQVQMPIGELIVMSGAIVTTVIGGNKLITNSKVKKGEV